MLDESVIYSKCAYHRPYKEQEVKVCLKPSEYRESKCDCFNCKEFLDITDKKTLEKIKQVLNTGYYLPFDELPQIEGLCFVYPTTIIESNAENYKQQIMLNATNYATELEIKTAINKELEKCGIDKNINTDISILQMIHESLNNIIKENKRLFSESKLELIDKFIDSLGTIAFNVDNIIKIKNMKLLYGKSREEHAIEYSYFYMLWQCCHKYNKDKNCIEELFWDSIEDMLNSNDVKTSFRALLNAFIKFQSWTRLDLLVS